ncbi:MAG: response regulator [Chloroflexi bacterium]|nr:response regulator [Chloroflexota bacterium]
MWQTNPLSIFLLVSSALIGSLSVYVWIQRTSLGLPILAVLWGDFLWLFGYAIALGVRDYDGRIFWAKFQYLGIGLVMIGIVTFTLRYADYSNWMTRRNLALISAVPVIGTLLVWTNEWHHLVWQDAQLVIRDGMALLKISYGPYFWFYAAYNYLIIGFSLLVFWRIYRRSGGSQRGQAAVILVGITFPLLANLLYLTRLNPFPDLDLTVLGYSLSGVFITWGMLRYFLLDMLAIPRNQVVQDMPDAVLVMDARDRLRDVNPAALKLLGLPERQVIGNTLQNLRKNDAAELDLLRKYQYVMEAQDEFVLGTPERPLYFNFRLTPLYDWRNKLSGRLIVMRDTTELHKRESALKDANIRLEDLNARLMNEMASRENMQNLMLEQQRTLMTLDERERLGRELHDGLGQMMGFLNLEAQTAQTTLENGDFATLQASLEKIASVARDGHDDVRSFILGLRTASSRVPFREGLRLILEHFCQRYGVTAWLDYPDNAPEPAFQLDVEMVVLQVLREALANIRKHSGALHVTVSFIFTDELARLEIGDDGVGFNPEARHLPDASPGLGKDGSHHFGLTMIREQIEKAGGRFEVRSAQGLGTRIIVQVPCLGQQPGDSDTDDLRTARGLRILLVDDHQLFLEGLRNLLKSRGLTVVGLAHDGLEAQSMADALRPDVIVMDVNMPGCGGLEATRLIKLALPKTQVLILTVSEDEDSLYEAMKNGASGYLPKSLDANEFVRLLASLSRGETPLTAGMALRLMRKFDRRGRVSQGMLEEKQAERPEGLTDRQWLILQSVAQGQKYKEIALQLRLSERTVKREMGQVLELLHLENRKDLLNYSPGSSTNS